MWCLTNLELTDWLTACQKFQDQPVFDLQLIYHHTQLRGAVMKFTSSCLQSKRLLTEPSPQ